MEKKLAILTLLLVCAAATCVVYYFAWHVPREHAIDLARRCRQDGAKVYAEFVDSHDNPSRVIWDDPEFHFNRKLNACLADIRYTYKLRHDDSIAFHNNQIVDVYANRPILYSHYQSSGHSSNETLFVAPWDRPGVPTSRFAMPHLRVRAS